MDWKFLKEAHVDLLGRGGAGGRGSTIMGCIIPYILKKPLYLLICSGLYVSSAFVRFKYFLQKVLAKRIVHLEK